MSEVEGRLKERDEQQITWLDNRLDDLKQLIQSQSQIMRDGHVSRATGAKGTAQSIPAQPYLKLDQLKDEAAIAASELSVPVSLSPRGEEALEPERSKEDTPRDVYYSGAAGILLGAAVVTCWNALFR